MVTDCRKMEITFFTKKNLAQNALEHFQQSFGHSLLSTLKTTWKVGPSSYGSLIIRVQRYHHKSYQHTFRRLGHFPQITRIYVLGVSSLQNHHHVYVSPGQSGPSGWGCCSAYNCEHTNLVSDYDYVTPFYTMGGGHHMTHPHNKKGGRRADNLLLYNHTTTRNN